MGMNEDETRMVVIHPLEKNIKGKTVCLCGPAPSIKKKTQGWRIDRFDVVCRTGNWLAVRDIASVDYGKRCDILFSNELYARTLTPNVVKDSGIKIIVCKADWQRLASRLHNELRVCPVTTRPLVQRHTGRPLLGLMALTELLRHDPAQVYVTGFDFYSGETMYVDEKYRMGRVRCVKDLPHDLEKSKAYLRRLAAEDKRIKLDPTLRRILGVKSSVEAIETPLVIAEEIPAQDRKELARRKLQHTRGGVVCVRKIKPKTVLLVR